MQSRRTALTANVEKYEIGQGLEDGPCHRILAEKQSGLQSGGLFNEFFAPIGIACNVFFVYARRTHKSPFVMVAAKPHFPNVGKRAVFPNLLR